MDRARFEQMLARRASRRSIMIGGGVAGLTASVSLAGRPTRVIGRQDATPAASPVATASFGGNPFTLGVASGDPGPGTIVLWTRLAPAPVTLTGGMDPIPYDVAWEVANDEAFGDIVQSGTAVAAPTLGHSVHVDVTGLAPAAEYFYRFMAGDEVSPIGRTRTAPAVGAAVDSLRFGFTSCSHWEHGYFTAYRAMAADDLDLIVHLGDYIYEYPAGAEFVPSSGVVVREHVGAEIVSLGDYRRRHAQYKTDPDLQAAHAAAPWIVTWDDHETENNYAADISENDDPVAAFLERRANAYQAYYENMPLRPESMPHGADMQLYRRIGWGNLAQFQVLDTRQYRSDQPCGDGVTVRCAENLDPNLTMTGPEQERWLLEGLDASPATWNILAQQVMMAQFDTDPSVDAYVMDLWDGYPAARNRILAHMMSRGTSNPVVLTGDIHSSWASDMKADFADPASQTIASEFVTTSVTADNPFGPALGQLLPLNPHIKYYDYLHGYTRATVTLDRWRSDFVTIADVTVEDATPKTAASFVVEAGNPGVVPA